MSTFFVHRGGTSGERSGFVVAEARIPLVLDPISGFHRGRLRVVVRAATTLRERLRVGLISKTDVGEDRRIGIDGSKLRWRGAARRSVAIASQAAGDLKRSDIFLSFEGDLVATMSRENFLQKSENHAIALHQVFDDGLKRFDEWLRGAQGGRSSQNFEQAVQWLLHFLGLKPVVYGGGGIDNEIDILAEWTQGRVILAVECTTNTSDLGRKVTVLHRRAGELLLQRRNWKVLPLVVTSLASDKLTRTERETAYNDGIVVVTANELAEMRRMVLLPGLPVDPAQLLERVGHATQDERLAAT